MTPTISQTLANLDAYLPRTPLISASETARLLGYPSTGALAKARQMGRLPIVMFKVPGRRGWFAATQTVRAWLESLLLPRAESVDEHERNA